MANFLMKVGDTSPDIEIQCQDSDGDPVDISGADISFHLVPQDGTTLEIDSPAIITDGANGKVKYEWADDDTNLTAQTYDAEFEVTFAPGTGDEAIETFPNTGNIAIEFVEELG